MDYSIFLNSPKQEIINKYNALESAQDVATLLEIEYSTLKYYLYVKEGKRYISFTIPKKNGDYRIINAPNAGLKILQQKLLYIFSLTYKPREPAHGFVTDRSIVTNAQNHSKKNYVLNLDLHNFFPNINFGRVYGLLMSYPLQFNNSVAATVAQLCCNDNALPQGAPTSPIISNMICYRLDRELQSFAKKNRSFYTRYADDITFSTNLRNFPSHIATYSSDQDVTINPDLVHIIQENGFEINPSKVRMQK